MASCVSARLAGVVTVVIPPVTPVMAVCAAWEDIAEGVVCASLCEGASRRPRICRYGSKKTRLGGIDCPTKTEKE